MTVQHATQEQLDCTHLRFYADLFNQYKWQTPQLDTSVFSTTLREIAIRIEQKNHHTHDLEISLTAVKSQLREIQQLLGRIA